MVCQPRASISQDYWGDIKEVGPRGEAPVEGLGDDIDNDDNDDDNDNDNA